MTDRDADYAGRFYNTTQPSPSSRTCRGRHVGSIRAIFPDGVGRRSSQITGRRQGDHNADSECQGGHHDCRHRPAETQLGNRITRAGTAEYHVAAGDEAVDERPAQLSTDPGDNDTFRNWHDRSWMPQVHDRSVFGTCPEKSRRWCRDSPSSSPARTDPANPNIPNAIHRTEATTAGRLWGYSPVRSFSNTVSTSS